MDSPYASGEGAQPCAIVIRNDGRGSLTFNTYLRQYMMLGLTVVQDTAGVITCGFYYSLSRDLVSWAPLRLLKKAGMYQAPWPECRLPGNVGVEAYPTIIDHADPSANFERPGQTPYLYYVHSNDGGLNRDLVRARLQIQVTP
jgi:hypothetical protein